MVKAEFVFELLMSLLTIHRALTAAASVLSEASVGMLDYGRVAALLRHAAPAIPHLRWFQSPD